MTPTPNVTYIRRWLVELADSYEREVRSAVTPTMYPLKAKKLKGAPTSKEEALNHLLWLCGQIRTTAEQERFDKSHEHINFIRGALWYMGRDI